MGRTSRKRKKRSVLPKFSLDYYSIISLMDWLKVNGFQKCVKLSPHYFPNTGRGLRLMSDKLSVGDLIVSIPYHLLITRNTVLKSDIPIDQNQTQLNSIQLLTAFLIWEKKKALKSNFYHYIESIPTSFDELPYFWQLNHLNGLIPKSLMNQIRSEVNKFELSLKKVLNELNMSLSDENINLFKWSFGAVNTRCIYLNANSCPNDCALAPFLDLLNHSCDAKIKAHFNEKTNCFEIHTMTEYSKYEEVFINYGNHSNRTLLIHYGFCSQHNINDSIIVSFSQLFDLFSDHQSLQRLQSLLRIKFISHSSDYYISSQGFDWNLEIFLKLISIEKWFEDSIIKAMIYSGDIKLNENEVKQYERNKTKLIKLLISDYDIENISLLENINLKTLLFNEINLLSSYF
jgi:hypothetical protein